MHPLIDEKMVETIRTTGKTNSNLPDRIQVLEEYQLPYDRPAEQAIITGCQILGGLPHVLQSLSRILDQAGVSHTFLSQEYCCGNNVYRPAIKARDNQALDECRQLSREFVAKNIETAKSLGAKRLVIFCSPCYPIYKYAFPDEDIVFYPTAIDEAVGPLSLPTDIDYYAGCYKLHARFAPVPMDLVSTNRVLDKIEGLNVHRISAPKCCYKSEGLAHMIGSIRTKLMVHICTGCYFQALLNLPPGSETKVIMLPELVEMAGVNK